MPQLVLVLALLLTAIPSSAGQAEPPPIKMRVATTRTKLIAFGKVNVGGPGEIAITLNHMDGDSGGVSNKDIEVGADGRFSGSFDRPETGTCEITASYASDGGPVSDTDDLECERPEWGTGEVRFQGSDEAKTIEVEVADSDSERSYGLMYRRKLASNKGMVFQYNTNSEGGFWMRNCLIDLSIAFYDATGEIVAIRDMKKCSEKDSGDDGAPVTCKIYTSGKPYRGALEVNLGAFDRWGVDVGDRILVTP